MTTRSLFGAAALSLLLAVGARAADSGPYRGPENNGIYPETGILRKWPEGGPQLLWKRRLNGTGFSSVTVADGKVYATAGGMCAVYVFGLDGTELARLAAGPSMFKRFGGGSRSTTIVRGDVAVTTTPTSGVYAVDVPKKEVRWKFDVSKDWGEDLGQGGWGYAESPMLYKDKVILGATSTRPEDPLLMAFSMETGEMAWGTGWGDPLDRDHHYQSPSCSAACFNHQGRWLIAFSAHSYQTCVDAETGKLLWQVKNRGSHTLTPVYSDGYLLWHYDTGWARDNSPKRSGLQMLRLSPDGTSYDLLWSRWEYMIGFSHAVILDGRVYLYGRPGTRAEKPDPRTAHGPPTRIGVPSSAKAGSGDGKVVDETCEPPAAAQPATGGKGAFLCLDAKTGALIASQPVSEDFLDPGHVVSADGLVFFLELVKRKGTTLPVPRLVMYEPTEKGFDKTGVLDVPVDDDDLKIKEIEWQGRTPPVIAEKRLFVRYGSIFAFDIRGEAPSHGWRQDGTGVASEARPPIRWDAKTNVLWSVDLPAKPETSPVAEGQRVYALVANGELVCVDTSSGKLLWHEFVKGRKAPSEIVGEATPVACEGWVYAALLGGVVVAFRSDGTRVWESGVPMTAGFPAVSDPLLAGRILVVQGREIVGFDAATGEVRWRVPVPDGKSFPTPVKVASRGRNLIVTGWGAVLRAEDGSVAAEGLPVFLQNQGVPALCGRDLYFWSPAEGAPRGSTVAAVRLSEGQPAGLTVVRLWQRSHPDFTACGSPLATEGLVYGLSAEGHLVALDATNGDVLYAQRVRDGKRTANGVGPELTAADKRIYVINADFAGRTFVVESGPQFKPLWSYTVQDGVGEPAFAGDRQYLLAGARLYAIGGATPQEPRAPHVVQPKPVAAPPPQGAPCEPFANDKIPDAWVFCGPIPGKALDTDHLAALGGRAAMLPVAGQEIQVGDRTLTFAKMTEAQRWRDRNFTVDRSAIDVTGCFQRRFDSTGYFFTIVTNDAPRYVRFELHTPGATAWNPKDRLDARAWLGGEPVADGDMVQLGKGSYALMIQVAMGRCEAHGRIWMGPHFEDISASYGPLMAEYERAAAAWPEYTASAARHFVLTPTGIERTPPDDAAISPPAPLPAAQVTPPEPEPKVALGDLKLRFAAIPGRAYEMQTTEVTQQQWQALMGTEPWKSEELVSVGPDYPAVNVSWREAVRFAERLSRLDGKYTYRLPLEAEWRHAALGGQDGGFCFASDKEKLAEYGWYRENNGRDKFAHPVAQLKPNAYGLYDVHGNAAEWCGDDLGPRRITKGGAWYSVDWFCDVRKSPPYGPLYRNYAVGLRLVREAEGKGSTR